jgi:uncharacterized protein (TIGR02594 family)
MSAAWKSEVARLQGRLKAQGCYAGRIDGDFGPLTLAGVLSAWGGPSWLRAAAGELGVAEVPGPGDNPRIAAYHGATALAATDDEVPWCSSFANWCMREAGLGGTGSAMARSWLAWGKACGGGLGSVVVLSRGKAPAGHVGFEVWRDATRVWLLGGNQGDRVKVQAFPRAAVLGCRWPRGKAAAAAMEEAA